MSDIVMVSVSTGGTLANDESLFFQVSDNGRFVVFDSSASNLVLFDTNEERDIFLHDRVLQLTERVSVAPDGAEANGASFVPVVSSDGRYVAFASSASNLVPGDTNGVSDIFLHDRATGVTERVSSGLDGAQANGRSGGPALSSDGRFVVFDSVASNLVPQDINGALDVFIHDRQTGATELVSVSTSGIQGNLASTSPDISADGRYVAFTSGADNLVPGTEFIRGDTNGVRDVFLHDRATGVTERVSVVSDGRQALGGGFNPSVSSDGQAVAFMSDDLSVRPGSDANTGIFVRDLERGLTERIATSGITPTLSGDGRFVAYAIGDVFVTDRETGETEIVTRASDGTRPNGPSLFATISEDGEFVIFRSLASDLVSGDTNNREDIFLAPNPFLAPDVPNGTDGPDTLTGRELADVIIGGNGNDLLVGLGGDDSIAGGDGADTISGGDGADEISGGLLRSDLRDVVFAGAGDDRVDGGPGNDSLVGGAGDDTIEGGAGADTVIGNAGDDVLTGSAFSDLLFCNDGFDFVNGGFGSDRVNGGADADRFFHVGVAGHGSDWIQDFSHAEGDQLLWGGGPATASQFQVNLATTAGAGDAGTDEAFVIYRPTGQILWALVDGAGESSLELRIDNSVYDLLA